MQRAQIVGIVFAGEKKVHVQTNLEYVVMLSKTSILRNQSMRFASLIIFSFCETSGMQEHNCTLE